MTDTASMNVTPSQFETLSKLIDVATVRHRVISHNIANVNTPGYQRKGVEFEASLSRAVLSGQQVDAMSLQPKLVVDKSSAFRVDGNNVDISKEMGRLNKNTLLHNTYLQILSTKLAMMRRAISGS